MKQFYRFVAVVVAAVIAAASMSLSAQRRVNPVRDPSGGLIGVNETKNPADSVDYSKLKRVEDENGNVVLVDTITGKEIPDTTQTAQGRVPKMLKPLFYSASVSVDIWDPVMRAFGQKYGLVEFSGELNLHNRYIPVLEVGLGETNHRPDDNNYTYRVPVTPYFRIGCNYNFLYNSNPDYQVLAGLRFGWSHFSYEVNDVTLNNGYWGQEATFNVPRQTGNMTYMQVLFGLRVKVFGPVSMGWFIRYRAKLHEGKAEYGQPWYVPGYGARNGAITGSFAITYTIPINTRDVIADADAKAAEVLGPELSPADSDAESDPGNMPAVPAESEQPQPAALQQSGAEP